MNVYAIFNDQSFNDMLTNNIISFEQLSPDILLIFLQKGLEALCWGISKEFPTEFFKDAFNGEIKRNNNQGTHLI